MGKVLFTASVVKHHIAQFHLPYLEWFGKNGYEVHVCAANDYNNSSDCVIPFCDRYYELGFSRSPFSPRNIAVYFRLKKIIEENNYDLIHCHTPVASVLTRLAARKARKKGTRVLYTTHGFHFYKGAPFSSWIYYLAECLCARFTDGIITVNHEDYEAAKKFGCDAFMINGIGIDTVHIKNTDIDRQDVRRKTGIPVDAFVVMTTAEINRNKNIMTGLKAFSMVSRENVYYLICGEGCLTEECKAYAKELHIDKNVIFAGYRKDISELLHGADVFMFPSLREGLGLAAIEAMAAGLPLIASDIRGVREYAVDRKNSILCSPLDADGFARGIALMYDHPELREAYGAEAQKTAEKYDISHSVDAMEEIYRRYIGLPVPVLSDKTTERVIM